MIKSLTFFFLLNLCFAVPAFSKELPTLFEVKIPVDQYSNTSDGLNKAFNGLIKKLSGSRDQKYLWKIGEAKLKKIDYVSSYAIEMEDGHELLTVRFNSATLIPELRNLDIPLIGFNRPAILFLIKIDTGEAAPIYLDANNLLESHAAQIATMIETLGVERGIYLELPEFDLEDLNLLSQPNVLFSPNQYIQQKFYNDAFLTFEVSRVGINQWSIAGDISSPSPMREKRILEFLSEQINLFLDSFLEVPPLREGSEGNEVIVSVSGIESFKDFQAVELELDKIFAIKFKNFHFFDRPNIDFKIQLFQTTDSLLNELRGNSKLMIKDYNSQDHILKLEFLN